MKKFLMIALALTLVLALSGCSVWDTLTQTGAESYSAAVEALQHSETVATTDTAEQAAERESETVQATDAYTPDTVNLNAQRTDGALDASDQFSERDLTQNASLREATVCTLTSGEDLTIMTAGVYVLSGSVTNATVVVDAGDDDKVQLVLDDVSVTNDDFPAVYVKNADKVFLTTTDSDNTLTVTGSFVADGDTNTDAVIFSRDDLVINGVGTLTVSSTDNGISGKDDVKITGGTLKITSVNDAIEANDSIRVAGGSITVTSSKDGLHAENDEDNASGYIYICGGTLDITAKDDGIHGTTIVQIDDGEISITAAEGIEGVWVQLNGGTVHISASDDGINGARKSDAYNVAVEITGGSLTIVMGAGDTDGIDSNGDLIITGGTIDVSGQSAFDYDGTCTHTGGTVIVNGEQVTEITNQFGGMEPGGMGGPGGGFGGFGGFGGGGFGGGGASGSW